MAINFNTEEWEYYPCPFASADVVVNSDAKPAFRESNADLEVDMHHLCAFAMGALPKHAETLKVSAEKNQPNPTPDTVFLEVARKQKALERRFQFWREAIFGERGYVEHIYESLINTSQHNLVMRNEFRPVFEFIFEQGLFNGIGGSELSRREFEWQMVKDCFYVCRDGLTRKCVGTDCNGFTSYEAKMVLWRAVLNEHRTKPAFADWLFRNTDRHASMLKMLEEKSEAKKRCSSCKFKVIATLHADSIQSIAWYLSNFRPEQPQQFFRIFVSAVLFAFIRRELMYPLNDLEEMATNYAKLAPEEQAGFARLRYNIDYLRRGLISELTQAMTRCLIRYQSGVDAATNYAES